ncbi:QWRF motif-containing protein 2 isoform X2 [Amborella trichopoda]|nr:QWRF motif-containing protein 2 isoform X2 [Amborella trichopoda]|eukprot:XP_020518483.1 QWRF motif-containing protein 2 isoform X2 [Amborella trichopoda]
MMVAAISATVSQETPKPPLGPSEKESNGAQRRPKAKEVTSRYRSTTPSSSSSSLSSSSISSSPRRCPSPNIARSPNPSTDTFSLPKRAISAERRRPSTPSSHTRAINGGSETLVSSSKHLLGRAPEVLWPSTRTLSVSFQGESFSLHINKRERAVNRGGYDGLKPSSTQRIERKATPERKCTPLRGKTSDQSENSKPFDNPHSRVSASALTRSINCTEKPTRAASILLQGRPSIDGLGRAFQRSINEGPASRRISLDSRLQSEAGSDKNEDLNRPESKPWLDLDRTDSDSSSLLCDRASDTESVSSGSNSGVHESIGISKGRSTPRGIAVPARFLQETNNRIRRTNSLGSSFQEPTSPLDHQSKRRDPNSPLAGSRALGYQPPRLVSSRKGILVNSSDSPSSSPRTINRALASPMRGPHHPVSPSKLSGASPSPSRGISPLRSRGATPMHFSLGSSVSSCSSSSSSILNFFADVRKGKKGANQIEDAHLLRLFYNRHLQWRFVNARAEAALSTQTVLAEKLLYNAWLTTSELRDSVTLRRIGLQQMRQKTKLIFILKGHMSYLEDWSLLERDHSNSLSGAIEALKASTLRLPVIDGARADIHEMRDAVGSAVDVMQAMGSSICNLLSRVEDMNSLVSELADVAAQEKALLDECRHLLSFIIAKQVEEWSLRTHLIQLRRDTKTDKTPMDGEPIIGRKKWVPTMFGAGLWHGVYFLLQSSTRRGHMYHVFFVIHR